MNKGILFFLMAVSSSISMLGQSYDEEVVNVGNVGMTISNVGTVGRPDVRNDPQGAPSFEYPINSGIEHLFEGGFWIGGMVNGQVAVSTGAIDDPNGYSTGDQGYEYTPAVGSQIQQRSSLTSSQYFSFDAISHQDLVMNFTDSNVIVPGTTIPITGHNLPLGAGVHLETYAWNYSFADYFIIFNYEITNHSSTAWDSVYFGMWTDMIVRNVNVATDAGSAFFNKGAGGFIDSLETIYVFDVLGDPGYTGTYGSMTFLGMDWRNTFMHPDNEAIIQNKGFTVPEVNANFWNFRTFDGTAFGAPSNDVERYEKMANGFNFGNLSVVQQVQTPNNRTQLLSVGPISKVEPGETVHFAIAFVAARQLSGTAGCPKGTSGSPGPDLDVPCARDELVNHLRWAKRTYLGEDLNANGLLDPGEDLNENEELNRYILPEPPETPKVKVVPTSNQIEIYWNNAAEFSVDPISKKMDFEGYRIYRSAIGEDLAPDAFAEGNLIAQFDEKGNSIGFNNGFEAVRLPQPVTFEGDTVVYHYKYVLDQVLNGWQYTIIVTAFDEGDEVLGIESLESSFVENTFRAWPGTTPQEDESVNIGVYPNPYKLTAAWDGGTATTKKLYFYNLPRLAEITVYTLSGDVVAVLDHNADTYRGEDANWFNQYGGNPENRVFSGGEHAWDLLSESNQSITQGIYIFTVKNLESGVVKEGTFTVLK